MSILRKATAIFFPERCPYCFHNIEPEKPACELCLRRIEEKQRPLLRGAIGFRCIASFIYAGRVRRVLIRIKFHGQTQFIPQIAVILAKDIRTCYADVNFDMITYVPMHEKDQKHRGFNQSQLLCRELSVLLGIPLVNTLNKVKRTKKQHTLSFSERRKNLSGAFEVIDREAIEGKRILIVDDIVTSGSTFAACCKKLNQAKPSLICCAAVADAAQPHDSSAVI